MPMLSCEDFLPSSSHTQANNKICKRRAPSLPFLPFPPAVRATTLCSQPLTHRVPVLWRGDRNKTRNAVTHCTAWPSNFAGIAIRLARSVESHKPVTQGSHSRNSQNIRDNTGHPRSRSEGRKIRNRHAKVPTYTIGHYWNNSKC
jgi:hypothetical protein